MNDELNEQDDTESVDAPETIETPPAEDDDKPRRSYGKKPEPKLASETVSIITVGPGIDCKVKGPITGTKYQYSAGVPMPVDPKDARALVAGGQWRYASA